METWKLIVVGILILLGFNLLAYGYVKRRIAAAKAEGYRRQSGASAGDGGSGFFDGSNDMPHRTDIWARDKGGEGGDWSDSEFGDGGGDGGGGN